MKTFEIFLKFFCNLDLLKSSKVNFDSILNESVFCKDKTSSIVFLDFYNVAFDLYIILTVWQKLLYLNYTFYFLWFRKSFSYKQHLNPIFESFYLIDLFYQNSSYICFSFSGYFSNLILLRQLRVDYKKIAFTLICQRFFRDYFYKYLVQISDNSTDNLQNLIPDFIVVFSSNDKIPNNAFEFMNFGALSLGLFDLNIRANVLCKFMYTTVCGCLNDSMFLVLIRLFFSSLIFVKFDFFKSYCSNLIKDCKIIKYDFCDFKFNFLYLSSISDTLISRVVFDDIVGLKDMTILLLAEFKRNLKAKYLMEDVIITKRVMCFTFLYLYLYLQSLKFV